MDIVPTTPARSRWNHWNIALWTAQGMLAFVYARAGILRTTQSIEALAAGRTRLVPIQPRPLWSGKQRGDVR